MPGPQGPQGPPGIPGALAHTRSTYIHLFAYTYAKSHVRARTACTSIDGIEGTISTALCPLIKRKMIRWGRRGDG